MAICGICGKQTGGYAPCCDECAENIKNQKANNVTEEQKALLERAAACLLLPNNGVNDTIWFDDGTTLYDLLLSLARDPAIANEAEQVCAEAYQLVGQLADIIPNAGKWLDNLAAHSLVHKDLLPVTLPTLTRDDYIKSIDEKTLMAIVMTLTAGMPNPSVIEGQIKRIKRGS